MRLISLRLGYVACALAAVLPLVAADPVRVETGLLTGAPGTNAEVQVYKGVPFAAPPVGDLRWKGPKPAAKWDGVRTADKFGNACMQRGAGTPKGNDRPMSEDCLYLNVYTAAAKPDEKRPVMVWIHGGSLTSGAGSIYNGEELAKKGVVVVTVNYRLGVFGYFAHPELTKESDHNGSGNYGLQDQVAALQWVQKNIAAFGGDPKRVTIFGESAGSWSVNMLVATPLAKGLFHRVIGESGAEFANVRKLDDAEKAGVKFAQATGAETLAALRAKSTEEVQKAGGFTGPNVDNWALPEDVYTIFAKGKQNDVPTLIGSNADEGTMFSRETTVAAFRELLEKRYGAEALKLYPAETDEQAMVAQANTIRDSVFGWEMRTWARMQNQTGKSKVFLYYFSRIPPGPTAARMRSFHSAEIAYVFHNVAMDTRRPWEDTDRKLADVMSSYWVNFATTGDPNGSGLLKWPVYNAKDDTVMGFGDKIELMPVPHKPALDFLDRHFEKRRLSGDTSQ
jgi:para-nitrobenzyl esterase